MGIDTTNVKGLAGSWGMTAKTCDTCKSAAASIFCRTVSAFMCLNCDSKIQSGARHEKIWMCEVCEQAPAAVTCEADAAALCVSCDSDIHSANPLARRHERVPVQPFFDSADSIVKSSPFSFLAAPTDHNNNNGSNCQQHQDVVSHTSSWLTMETNKVKTGDLFFSEMDPFIDFQNQNSFHDAAMDSVVPVQTKLATTTIPVINNEICFDVDFCRSNSKFSTFSYQTQSQSHSVSSSSLDVGVVPDGNSSYSDISYTLGQPSAVVWPTTAGNNQATARGQVSGMDREARAGNNQAAARGQVSGMDREARVLRYREKRKNRKFEKTLRYASRKAYAESRPRIKGRFAKRTETGNDVVDRRFNSASAAGLLYDTQYDIVPSF